MNLSAASLHIGVLDAVEVSALIRPTNLLQHHKRSHLGAFTKLQVSSLQDGVPGEADDTCYCMSAVHLAKANAHFAEHYREAAASSPTLAASTTILRCRMLLRPNARLDPGIVVTC